MTNRSNDSYNRILTGALIAAYTTLVSLIGGVGWYIIQELGDVKKVVQSIAIAQSEFKGKVETKIENLERQLQVVKYD